MRGVGDMRGRLLRCRVVSEGRRSRLVVAEDACRGGRTVVLKERLVRARDPRPLEAEFAATAESVHPNLLRALETGRARRTRWVLREHAEGRSVSESERVEIPRAAALLADVAAGLADLHERGWCHGAVRAEHVLEEVSSGGGRRARLIVSGAVRREGDRIAPARLEDLAPEDRAGAPAGPARDQHGLGRLAYRLLTGRSPAPGRRPAAPSSVRPGLPPEVDGVLIRLLAPRPQDRYASIREAAEAIWRALGGRAVWCKPGALRAAFRTEDLLGREIGEWLEEVVRHGQGTVLLRGAPGAGKGAVLQALGRRLMAEGGVWLRLEAPADEDAAAGAVANLARRLVYHLDACGLREIADDLASSVDRQLTPDGLADRTVRAIDELSGRTRVVLGVEGLERWSRNGPALVRHLGLLEGPDARRQRILVKTLDVPARPPGSMAPGVGEHQSTHEVCPLDQERIRERLTGVLRAGSISAELVARIHEETGGLPELIARLLGDLAVSGRLRPWPEGWILDPQSDPGKFRAAPFSSFVERRIEGLGSRARRTLECLSVLRAHDLPRRTFDRALGAGWDAGLEDLVAEGLVVQEDERNRFFESETPRGVYRRMPSELRVELNRALARALEPEASEVRHLAAWAFHLRESGQTSRAIYASLRAAESLEQGGRLAAAAHEYIALLVLLRGRERAQPVRRDALERLLKVKIRLGEMRRCESLYAHLICLAAQAGDEEQEARLYLDYAEHLISTRRYEKCERLVGELASRPHLEAQRWAVRGKLSLFLPDIPAARIALARAMDSARSQAEERTTTMVLNSLAILMAMDGKYRNAQTIFRKARALARRLQDKRRLADSLFNAGTLAQMKSRVHSARRLWKAALNAYRRIGSPLDIASCYGRLALAEKVCGRLLAAQRYARVASQHGESPYQSYERLRTRGTTWPWHLRHAVRQEESTDLWARSVRSHVQLTRAWRALRQCRLKGLTRILHGLRAANEARIRTRARLLALGIAIMRGQSLAGHGCVALRQVRRLEDYLLGGDLRATRLPLRVRALSAGPLYALLVCAWQLGSHEDSSDDDVMLVHSASQLLLRTRTSHDGKGAACLAVRALCALAGADRGDALLTLKSKLERGRESASESASGAAVDRAERRSPPSTAVADTSALRKAARLYVPVVVVGPTGSGKTWLVRNVFGAEAVTIDCNQLNDDTAESILFGHVRGAYSGAISDSRGLLEMAHGGVAVFESFEDLSLGIQAKLLRVLDTGLVVPLGGAPRRARFATVVIVGDDLGCFVRTGRLRSDLVFRVQGLTIRVNALREDPSRAPVLLRRFLEEASRGRVSIARSAAAVLRKHDWPGNIREVRNCALRLAVLGVEVVTGKLLEEVLGGACVGSGGDGAEEADQGLMALLSDSPLAAGELAARARISMRSAQRGLRNLVISGKVRRLGRGRTSRYVRASTKADHA